MNCPKCNSYVDDKSKFCSQCGAAIAENEKPNEGYRETQDTSENFQSGYTYGNGNYQSTNQSAYNNSYNYSGGYGFGYNQASGELTPHFNNTLPIIMLIINIIFPNIIGIVLSVLSLMNYNKYENELRNRNFSEAEMFKRKSKKLSKIALVLQIIFVILAIIALIAFTFFGVYTVIDNEPGYFFFSEDFLLMAINAIHN